MNPFIDRQKSVHFGAAYYQYRLEVRGIDQFDLQEHHVGTLGHEDALLTFLRGKLGLEAGAHLVGDDVDGAVECDSVLQKGLGPFVELHL